VRPHYWEKTDHGIFDLKGEGMGDGAEEGS
jgi:hypothetical protein